MEIAIRKRNGVRQWRLSVLKYAAVLRVSVVHNLAYLSEVFFRALMMVVITFILIQLWKTTFGLHGTKAMNGFSIDDMVWYLVMTHPHN